MSQEQAKQFIDQATVSLQGGQFGQALELADQAIALSPNDADAHVLRGICLSQLQRPQEATEAFRKALSINAYNPKAYYNLAVHYYSQGEKQRALEMAQEAMTVDPRHSAARELASRIQSEIATPPAPSRPVDVIPETPAATVPPASPAPTGAPGYGQMPPPGIRSGYEVGPVHTIPWVERLGGNWTAIGWGVALLNLIVFAWSLTVMVPMFQLAMTDPQAFQRASQNQNPVLSLLGWVSGLSVVGYTVIDLVDRKGNFLWIIPQICCCGIGFITLPVYMLLGRK